MKLSKIAIIFLFAFLCINQGWSQVRIKELVRLEGIEYHQLIGYGIVVGLNGTGDSKRAQFTTQSVVNMLQRFGITVPPNRIKLKNVAAVMVTAEIPSFMRQGDRVSVTVSSLGDAKSLEGGVLLLTPLVNQQGKVIAMAQGPITVGGFSVQTTGGGGVRQNHTLVGRIPDGAVIQQNLNGRFQLGKKLHLAIREQDITTQYRIVEEINKKFGSGTAHILNPGTIEVMVPDQFDSTGVYAFLSQLEQLRIQPDVIARVVINERTGTVVVGGNVTVLPAAVAHGNLSVEIRSEPIVSQPAPFSKGQTVVVPNTNATVYQDQGKVVTIENATTVQQVAQALNAMGLTPRDIIAVMQALKEVGALKAELVIM